MTWNHLRIQVTLLMILLEMTDPWMKRQTLELDQVEPEDLMRILQEWFGDEWQQQLHDLCEYSISQQYQCIRITLGGLRAPPEHLIDWVEKYEWLFPDDRWYYRYEEKHLPACLFYVHALLHVLTYIYLCSPAWTAWADPADGDPTICE
ncbi:hypothetical protein K439DRAFT_1619055 [Ramaria rubella]|nr:hypothetical protein K439DRAFT_1619055 [Ramaria rubella]